MAKRQNVVVQKARNKFEFRQGTGYSTTELKAVGLTVKQARNMGIRVDSRRKSSYDKNIEFLMGQYELSRQKIVPKEKAKKAAPKKVAPKKVAPKKATPAPVKKEVKTAAPKPKPKTVAKPAAKIATPKPKPATKTPVKAEPKPKPVKAAPKPALEPVEKAVTPKPKATPTKKLVVKKTTAKAKKTTVKTTPKPAPGKKAAAKKLVVKKTTAKAKKKTATKKYSTEDFHKMYNEETSKNAIWRGKESTVYLKWLDKKKRDLGL